jgi:hypothetical protein
MPDRWMQEIAVQFERDYAEDPEPFEDAAYGPNSKQPDGFVSEAAQLLGVDQTDEDAWGKIHGLAWRLIEAAKGGPTPVL